jgi:hypothetical protein
VITLEPWTAYGVTESSSQNIFQPFDTLRQICNGLVEKTWIILLTASVNLVYIVRPFCDWIQQI